MSTLYVIGNGFDLYHQIDTYYSSFGLFLQEKYPDFYKNLARYLYLPNLDEQDKESLKNPLWSDFESSFTRLDTEELLEDFKDYMASPSDKGFTDGDWVTYNNEVKKIVDILTVKLRGCFREFIYSIKYPASSSPHHLKLEHAARFLSFNYTDTLERYYNIKQNKILYIHGKAERNDSKLILGHGVPPAKLENKRLKPPDYLKPKHAQVWQYENLEGYDYSYVLGMEEANQYFIKSFKNCERIIEENKAFFDGLSGVQTIYVLGHSLSNVDMPYFIKIASSINLSSVSWKVTYHDANKKETMKNSIMELGVNQERIELIRMESLRLFSQLSIFGN